MDLSISELQERAARGDPQAQVELGYRYFYGNGVRQDYHEALRWFRLAAEQGYLVAQFNLGVMYDNGFGVSQDYHEAVRWYGLAAEKGDSSAQFNLGLMYENGHGVAQDYHEAVRWYRLAAEKGDSSAQFNLGLMYENGHGVAQDYHEAVRWYRLAAEQRDSSAQNNLGLMYENGQGLTQDYHEAVRWYRLAAEQGLAIAQRNLGLMYENGHGVAQDYHEAVRWFRLAAEQGDAAAQFNLGEMYAHGQGVAQDYVEAKRWLQKSADQGHPEGPRILGVLYFHGSGVPQDYKEAEKWFALAVSQGDSLAREYLKEVQQKIAGTKQRVRKASLKTKKLTHSKSQTSQLDTLFIELNKLIGLTQVKDEIAKLMKFVSVQKMRLSKGLKKDSFSLHSVFAGSPGTGKTTVARIYGKMLKALGLLSKGHVVETDRSGLVAGFVGQTELKTDEKIREALGGILFIDEAYSLSKGQDAQWDYGAEAISILVKRMEDHRDDFVVIVAGYDKPMDKFLRSNEGLRSRFSTYLHFDDYSPQELVAIFELLCNVGNYEIGPRALELVRRTVEREYSQKDESFGNARYVRNLFQNIVRNQSVRLADTIKNPSHKDLVTILPDDIPEGPQYSSESLDEFLVQLNRLIGLDQVKSEIYQLTQFAKIHSMRHEQGLEDDPLSLHCVFFGNPGTGKTTVARIYGKLLNALGLLSRGHVVETDRSGLVAGYIGQTEIKTDEKIREALGGILFIDEAYALNKGEDDQKDFGNEAISTLLKRMEDHRHDLVVIVAGYDRPMAEFLESNEGLKSRFPTHIHFPDYSPQELVEIFKLFCKEKRYEIQATALDLIQYFLENEYRNRDETFGNARLVRNLFEKVIKNQRVRISENILNPTASDLVAILPDDVRRT